MGGVEITHLVRKDRDYPRNMAELISLIGGKAGGETHGGAFIGIEDFRRVLRERRNRSDDGGVPMVVGGKNMGLVVFGNVNNEGFMTIGLDGNGHLSKAERDDEEDRKNVDFRHC